MTAVTHEEATGKTLQGRLADSYLELTKPGITAFVTITAAVGFYVAAGGYSPLTGLANTSLGVCLATAGALALNQYLERDRDALMKRTEARPLPSGRLRPDQALRFGWVLLIAGVAYLFLTVGWLPALLTAFSAAVYDLAYTPLKRRTHLATFVGAVPGALPALIGWSAFGGQLDPGGWSLFGILFLWQLVHVLALGWNLREDYRRAGFQLIPADDHGRFISSYMLMNSVALIPVSLLPALLGLTTPFYLLGALVLGTGLLVTVVMFAIQPSRGRCSRIFFGSLIYHPVLLAFLVLNVA